MKRKLTLTLDPEVIRLAKKKAESEGTSLSKLIEDHFRNLQRFTRSNREFSRRWKGKFKMPRESRLKKDPRLASLLDKHAPPRGDR